MYMDERLKNEELRAKLESAGSYEEAVEILKAEGVEVNEGKINAAFDTEGELGEELLETVAGGSWLSSLLNRWYANRYKAGGGGYSVCSGGKGAFGGGGKMGGR